NGCAKRNEPWTLPIPKLIGRLAQCRVCIRAFNLAPGNLNSDNVASGTVYQSAYTRPVHKLILWYPSTSH
ncbi:MAG: hypothetical protein N3G20_08380, partial [Verrucomicrobiae bacterium]|nr:hypothetical protein [Verrucomicrobiae bacterium]